MLLTTQDILLRRRSKNIFQTEASTSRISEPTAINPLTTPFAKIAGEAVASGECSLGIFCCGTGVGISMAANKVRGIRAANCADTFSARMTRLHNNANVLCLGSRVIGAGLALDMVDLFVDTPFSGEERHQRRIDQVMAIENEKFSK